MDDAIKWINKIKEELPGVIDEMYFDAETMPTYGKAKKYVAGMKHDWGRSYTANPEEQVDALWNSMVEAVHYKIVKDADNARIEK